MANTRAVQRVATVAHTPLVGFGVVFFPTGGMWLRDLSGFCLWWHVQPSCHAAKTYSWSKYSWKRSLTLLSESHDCKSIIQAR